MKKTMFFTAMAALMISFSGNVAAQTEVTLGSACYELQEQKPELRSVGSATDPEESEAKQLAFASALAEYASRISAAVETACVKSGIKMRQYVGDDESGQNLTDASYKSGTFTKTMAKQVIKNSVILKTQRYIEKNRQYTIYVCIENSQDFTDMVTGIEDALKEKISPEQRKILEERHAEFEEMILNEMKGL